jgi:glycosyltransferase involved in cell wall biosynthesis
MARPRVLHVFKDYWPTPGGVERTIKLLVDGLQGAFECTVLVNASDSRTRVDVQNDVTIVRAGTLGKIAMTPISPDFARLFWRIRADLVHLHFPNPPGEMSYLGLKRSVPMVLSYHNDLVRPAWAVPLYRPWLRRVLRLARRILVGDASTADGSADLRPVRDRCTIVPYGIDTASLRATDRTARLTARLRQQSQRPIVLFVGQLRYYKGLDILIRAVQTLDVTVLIVGSGTEKAVLQRLSADLGMEDRVRFVGAVPECDLPAYYHAADLFVLPSVYRSESFGIAMLEAQACGVPCVSTELGTATSVVNQHGLSGLVVTPGSVGALTDAIRTLLADPDLRRRMGRRARELADRFTAARMVARISDVYDEVLGYAWR